MSFNLRVDVRHKQESPRNQYYREFLPPLDSDEIFDAESWSLLVREAYSDILWALQASLDEANGIMKSEPDRRSKVVDRTMNRYEAWGRLVGYSLIYSLTIEGQEMIAARVVNIKGRYNDLDLRWNEWGILGDLLGNVFVRRRLCCVPIHLPF